MGGFKVKKMSPGYKQTIGEKWNKDQYLRESDTLECTFFKCEIGFVLIDKKNAGDYFRVHGLQDLDFMLYIEYSTDNNVLILGTIVLEDKNFPLVLCPTEYWLNFYGDFYFDYPNKNDYGFGYSSLKHSHHLKVLYPERDEGDLYMCGRIRYKRWNELYIGYKILKRNEPKAKMDEIDLLTQKLVCSNDSNENNYHTYLYERSIYGWSKIISYPHNYNQIFLQNIFYLYYKEHITLKEIEKKGLDYTGETDYIRTKLRATAIKPACIIKIANIRGSLQLYDNNIMKTSPKTPKNSSYQIVYIEKKDFNILKKFSCNIFIEKLNEKISGNKILDRYYSHTFDGKLAKIDRLGNKLFIDKLRFDNTLKEFGKYNCTLEPYMGTKLDESEKLIERLGIIFIPSKDLDIIRKVYWKHYHVMSLECDEKISDYATIQDIAVYINNMSETYQYSKDPRIFKKIGKTIVLNKANLEEKGAYVKDAYIECTYIVDGYNATFNVFIMGSILGKENVTIRIRKEDSQDNNGVFIGILTFLTLIIVSIIVALAIIELKRRKKKRAARMAKSTTSTSDNSVASESETSEVTKGKKSVIMSKNIKNISKDNIVKKNK
uniref:RING-type domain-containing protein n=1 Tax=Parastrongyloides trichosuri TaxID=131310 RepID=A0A0N5A4D7_PARTI